MVCNFSLIGKSESKKAALTATDKAKEKAKEKAKREAERKAREKDAAAKREAERKAREEAARKAEADPVSEWVAFVRRLQAPVVAEARLNEMD